MATTPGMNYDVVIVGSGFDGSISASRLALAGRARQLPSVTVALNEQG
jgi:choline dehydrogenase-like flavoprotein